MRASEAQLHLAKEGESKKRLPIPAPILARVSELASFPNEIPSNTDFVNKSSRKWRLVHRK